MTKYYEITDHPFGKQTKLDPMKDIDWWPYNHSQTSFPFPSRGNFYP